MDYWRWKLTRRNGEKIDEMYFKSRSIYQIMMWIVTYYPHYIDQGTDSLTIVEELYDPEKLYTVC